MTVLFEYQPDIQANSSKVNSTYCIYLVIGGPGIVDFPRWGDDKFSEGVTCGG